MKIAQTFARGLTPLLLLGAGFAGVQAQLVEDYVAPEPEDLMMYFIFVDRFENGDTSNDRANPRGFPSRNNAYAPAVGNRFHGGDLEGIRQRLPYIKTMGFNAIWMTPFVENVSNYHGYAAYDHSLVDPNFGDLDKVNELIDEANALGIAVFFDIVANHMGNNVFSSDQGFPAFRPPPNQYNMRSNLTTVAGSSGYPEPFHLLSHFHAHGNISDYFNNQQVVLGELSGLDDLRTEDPYIRDAMTAIWVEWIQKTRVNGYRIDTVKHVNTEFWSTFSPAIRDVVAQENRTNFFFFGEIFDSNYQKVKEYVGRFNGGGVERLDAALDFGLYYAMSDVFARNSMPTRRLREVMVDRFNVFGTYNLRMLNWLDNHDLDRFLCSAFKGDTPAANTQEAHARLAVALTFLMAAPGPPVVYYGTEQGFNGCGDPGNREDMFAGQWEQGPSLGNNFDPTSPFYTQLQLLTWLRATHAPLRRGAFSIYEEETSVTTGRFAFARRFAGEEVIIMLNTSPNPVNFTGNWTTTLAPNTVMVNALDPSETITLNAQSRFPAQTLAGNRHQLWVSADAFTLEPPEVSSVSPADGASAVALDTRIDITFNSSMDRTSTEANVRLLPIVDYTVEWSDDDTMLSIIPTASLTPFREYTVAVLQDAKSADGDLLLRNSFTRFTTDRFPNSMSTLPAPTTIQPTSIAIVANGNASEWPAPTVPTANTGALIGDQVYAWTDAVNDDNGPGTYTYPTNAAFSGSEADVLSFRVAFNDQRIFFLINAGALANGASFYTPYFGIGIDTADGGPVDVLGYTPGPPATFGVADLLVRPDAAPEYLLVYTGTAQLYNTITRAAVAGTLVGRSGSTIEFSVPRSALGLSGELTNQRMNLVVFTGLEFFAGMRPVEVTRGNYEPGGGAAHGFHPNVFDLVGAPTTQLQQADLAGYTDQYPSYIENSVITLRLFDQEPLLPDGEFWEVY